MPKAKLKSKTIINRPAERRLRVQRVVSQATSAELEYEMLSRAIDRGYEQIRHAEETLAVLQDKQSLRLLEQQSQKRRLANDQALPRRAKNL